MKKNKFFLAGLPVIALALGMMVSGCDDGSTSGGNNDPKKIEITGITGNDGNDVVIMLFTKEGIPTVMGMGTVSGSSVTFELQTEDENGDAVPYKGTGSYKPSLIVVDSGDYLYTGGKTFAQLGVKDSDGDEEVFAKLPTYTISSTVSKIAFDQFKERAGSVED